MIRPHLSRRIVFALGLVVALSIVSLSSHAGRAAPQGQSGQNQGQDQSQEKPKKKGGFFDSLKSDSSSNTSSGSDSQSNSGATQGSNSAPSQGSKAGSNSNQKPDSGKGGFFSGLKAVTGSSSQQTSATASAGSMGVGNQGAKVGQVTPTPADRQAVTQMENYSVSQGDLGKFIENGHLKPKQ